ncbi:MAG: hypothetical protein Q8S58_08995 [Bosea sp. (in: a-proteobacteria)]|uniref:hypothetical protein n=1 Tax=Bosea sp. (in: a-proteobacteria) TaxID=1871050 RepID=UPI00273646DD|nr:hypothetical protein [Bosea sp. (in: a-proteobacteria)]MDP3256969.1 hypothetical protein [Bosea sp. (in: a-proteobacteria)]MDP3319255.1 hypothetical protein [Bosea sp. (in: a-proteobacteria)]
MQEAYIIAGMTPDQVDAAFLLVRRLKPSPDLEGWRTKRGEGDAPAGRRQDVRVATNPRGHVQGLCLCREALHMVHGAILDVPLFVVASAADGPGVAAALVADLCAIAGRLGCSAVRIRTGDAPRAFHGIEHSRQGGTGGIALLLDSSPMADPPWAVRAPVCP